MLRLKRMCRVSVSRDFNSIPKLATLIAVLLVLALALPAVAGAQLLDPTLDQYAPSTQQIDKQVKGEGGAGGGGGQAPQGEESGQVPQGGGNAQAPQAPQGGVGGGLSPGGDGGEASPGGDGGQAHQGSNGTATPAGAEGGGLDARVVDGVPLTGFDLLAVALAAAVIAGTAVLLRRLSRRPEPGA
jgi:hypothetical protein